MYHPYSDFLEFPHCLLLQKAVSFIILALMFLINAGPCLFLESAHSNPIQEIRITWLQPTGYWSKPGRNPSRPLLVRTPPAGKMQIGTSLRGNLTFASNLRSEVILLTMDDVETISGFITCLYEVRQPRYRPALNIPVPIIISARLEDRPGRYNQDITNQFGLLIPSPLHNSNRRGPHLRA
jgi:hypothetical protein